MEDRKPERKDEDDRGRRRLVSRDRNEGFKWRNER